MSNTNGFIVELGEGVFNHRFGGQAWKITGKKGIDDEPILLLTLDLLDPKLETLKIVGFHELPLCSYINSDIWHERQVYSIDLLTRNVVEISTKVVFPTIFDREVWISNPLPEKSLKLRDMVEGDHPISEELYWGICENFVGGNDFIRILGSPLWLEGAEAEVCECGVLMQYVCSIGYEDINNPSGIIDNRPLFIGEAALYFFLCKTCLLLHVISQST